MNRRKVIWVVLSLACLLGALWVRHRHTATNDVSQVAASPAASGKVTSPTAVTAATTTVTSASTAPFALFALNKDTNASVATAASKRVERLKYRLSNTTETVGQLTRNPHAILLENALIDSSRPLDFTIPDSLKSQGDPGTYLVQARGPVNDAFRRALAEAGAVIVSYIPNNAYLVRLTADGAQQLAGIAQKVLPWEPYYKLDMGLLKNVLEGRDANPTMNVLVFGDARVATLAALAKMGVIVTAESPSPFGVQLALQNVKDPAALAREAGVQRIETASARHLANDLSRARVRVATNSIAGTNYLGLTGKGVTVDMNDTGADATHPDLLNRITSLNPLSLLDANGHGTHVAGIIMGNGAMSLTVTNARGSIMPGTNGQFRGKASLANLFVMPINDAFSDFDLQSAAARTNALISNNSWGYANHGYDIASASFDAAVRDALPDKTGSQPVLFVFAAGNDGNGDDDGGGGNPESISSPSTAKNVLTVGAIEQPRRITNEVTKIVGTNTTSSTPWIGSTDSSNQVAGFSARGNVGIGIEGDFGRFKPDVMAPGTFVISTRSQQWDEPAYYNPTNYIIGHYTHETVATNGFNVFPSVFVPPNGVRLVIQATATSPLVDLPIYVRENNVPTPTTYDVLANNTVTLPPDAPLVTGTIYYFAIGNPTNRPVTFDVTVTVVTTNDSGNYFEVLSNLNNSIGEPDWYRYESGTSMAAPAVSGVLALMQEFFQVKHITNSPALMKALLINGARPVSGVYDFQVQNSVNYQGWGLISLTNSLPESFTNVTTIVNPPISTPRPMLMFDQSPTNALATGDSHTIFVNLSDSATDQPLRVSLVWTDPPGNPAAGIKLVNNLDLIITNLDEPDFPLVYYGNDIQAGANFNVEWDTNDLPNLDFVNNVENIYLSPTLGTNYSITVVGRSVNVNAVTAHTNGIVQDYALVIASGNGQLATGLTLTANPVIDSPGFTNLTVMTNEFDTITHPNLFGQSLGNQRVGANSPLLGTNAVPSVTAKGEITQGQNNQWHFYTITNATSFTNALFATSLPVELATSRMGATNYLFTAEATRPQADIDLYVSTDASLLSLNSNAIALAQQSLGRGGYEQIVLTNAVPNQVYYIGVKSEDHEAAEYSLTVLFSLFPFGDGNGNYPSLTAPADIPDGSPALPGAVPVTSFAVAEPTVRVRRVIVTNTITHQNFGDLIGTLKHDGEKPTVLHNHTPGSFVLNQTSVYDDAGANPLPGVRQSEGPGNLTQYIGDPVNGQWTLIEVDNALTHTGRVDYLNVHIDPITQNELPSGATNGVILSGCLDIQPLGYEPFPVVLPFNATAVQFCILSNTQPLQLIARNGAVPTQTNFEYTKAIPVNGDCLTISLADLPPLQPGLTLFFAVINSNNAVVPFCYQVSLSRNLSSVSPVLFGSTNKPTILDDAVNYSAITIETNRAITAASVGVVLNHPRVSDLALTLINPLGERYLLFENRGGVNATNLGHLDVTTNFFGTSTAGNATANTNVLSPVPTSGTLLVDYQFFTVPDAITVFYDGAIIFSSGLISGAGTFSIPYGPGVGTSITIVMNLGGNPNTGTAWNYTPRVVSEDFAYLTFTEDPTLTKTPVKFGIPPFDLFDRGSNYILSDFEFPISGEYLAVTNIPDARGGWTMLTNDLVVGTNLVSMASNQVSVVTDRSSAQGGSNYLALANGTISRTVPTTAGKKYTVSYYYRGPGLMGWYRGEGNANDSADPEVKGNNGSLIGRFTFPQGVVGQGFQFEGTNGFISLVQDPDQSYVQVRESLTLDVGAGGGFTVEGWINPTNLSVQAPLVEWLAPIFTNAVETVVTNTGDTNLVILAGPFLNPGSGHFYYMLASTNWTRSEAWARQIGGHLVTVNDANEQAWIYNTFAQSGGTNRTLWIGLNDLTNLNTFAWVDGQTNVFYTNWLSGQPVHCPGNQDRYVAMNNPTNAQPGLWTLKDINGRGLCPTLTTNRIHGIVEVDNLKTNGVQLWVSVTNATVTGTGRLYADIVDVNNVSHILASAPGLIQSNVYQHVALTYSTNSGIANLYYNGTNVASTNLGVIRPRTGGDLLIGKDMTRSTNSIFLGKMDEMSVYQRFLSPTEIALIYRLSTATNTLATNGLVGKFDTTVTPAFGLAEAQVSIGGSTNIIFGANNTWQNRSFTFIANTSSIPIQITGLQPGILLDSFSVFEAPPGNLFYLPEETLSALVGQGTKGKWTLELQDLRTGLGVVTNTAAQLISWQMQFVYQNINPIATPLSPYATDTNSVPAGKTVYYTVDVPAWATSATNILISSTSPVDLLFNQTNPPTGLGVSDFTLLSGSTGGNGAPDLVTNGVPPLRPGQTYYLGVRNSGAVAATVVVRVDFNITTLTNGLPFFGRFATNDADRYFAFDVSSNAYEATFQLLTLSSNADLVVRRGLPLPSLTNSDFGSFNTGTADENIFVLTNSSPVAVSPGRWYLGVIKRADRVVNFSVLAKELTTADTIRIIDLENNVPFDFTAGPGAALTNFFRFAVSNAPSSVHFELYNLSGNGDLTVQTNLLPLAPPFWHSSQLPGRNAELIYLNTNSAQPSLNAQYYLGVPNHETNLITYTILAVTNPPVVFPAFPGAEGAGAGAIGGRATNGTVYHVTNLRDSGPGSLRDAVSEPLRTVVFDVSGTIQLASRLKINSTNLTIAGQTAPGDGITIQGWVTSVQNTHDIIIRHVRFRPGDINCPTNQDDAFHFDEATNVIADHISATWSIDEALSATDSTNVTVQWSVIADSLNDSCHIKGQHGYGSLLRYGAGRLSYHHNLYADNHSRNPRLGDNLSLDFVNNVIYNWGIFAGYSADDSLDNPLGFTNRLNYVCNYLIAGTNTATNMLATAFLGGSTNTWIYQTNNFIDSDRNGTLNGANTGWAMFTNTLTGAEYTQTNRAFELPAIAADEAILAYERVLAFVGTGFENRDAVDRRIVNNVRTQSGSVIDSQNQVGGWPSLATTVHPLDTDQDGIPDYWETTFGESVTNANHNADRDLDGYSDLEEYINWLAGPHALTITNTSVDVDLYRLAGNTGNLTFFVTNAVNGTVYLTNRYYLTNGTTILSNTVAVFTPTNVPANFSGYASFSFYATNNGTVASFGLVPVSVVVSATSIESSPTIIDLTNGIPFDYTAGPGEVFTNLFRYTTTNSPGAIVFELYNQSGNGDLVVQTNGLPVAPNYYRTSRQLGTNAELILIQTNNPPNLNAQYYLGVPNNETNLISYTILARELVAAPVIIDLTNGIPYDLTNAPPGPALTTFFRFTVTNTPGSVWFQLYNLTGDGDLTVMTNQLPFAPIYYTNRSQLGGTPETILIRTNASLTNVTYEWYLGVPNNALVPIDYTILAIIPPDFDAVQFANTLPATRVTGITAQLNGMATPNGQSATAWFEWGRSTAYGNQTPLVDVGTNYSVIYVTNQISGLVPNVPYHYRLAVSNALSTIYGFDQVLDQGNVAAWGASYIGQTTVPLGLSNVVTIAAGYDHSLALKNDGAVVVWGDNTFGQTNVPSGLNNVIGIAGGQKHSMALRSDGTVAVWGANFFRQTNVPPGLSNVVAIASGSSHCLALQSNGLVVSWGYNGSGQTNVPAGLSNVVAIAGGYLHSLALKNDGTVVGWGFNGDGETSIPAGLTNVVAIGSGELHSLALRSDGTIVAWGYNGDGETNVPPFLGQAVAIAGGGYHALAIRRNASVQGWGYNGSGETTIPAGLSNVVAVAGGDFHSLALASQYEVNFTNRPPFFLRTNPPPVTMNEETTLLVTNRAADPDPAQFVTYQLTNSPAWATINSNGIITLAPLETDGPGTNIIYTVAWDNGIPSLSRTNQFTVVVREVNTPPVFLAPSNTVVLTIPFLVPFTISCVATDFDLPVNPLTFSLVSGPTNLTVSTNGVIDWTPTEAGTNLVFVRVTDTNISALVNRSYSVTNQFTLIVTGAPPPLTISSIVYTNIGGKFGFLLSWLAPTNDLFQVQWTPVIPTTSWNTFSNIISYNTLITPSNSLFNFFDDGSQTGGFDPTRFYRIIKLAPITNVPPVVVTLTNGLPYAGANLGGTNAPDYYRYTVSTNAARVQFEVTNPSGDVTLVARRGLPLPSLGSYDYLSTNANTNPELIVVFTNSTPINLAPGDWYLAVANISGSPATYTVKATEWSVTGQPINPSYSISGGNFCLSWNSLPGVYYYVQGLVNLASTNWVTVSPTLLATTSTTTNCIPLPSAYNYFRIVEGIVIVPGVPNTAPVFGAMPALRFIMPLYSLVLTNAATDAQAPPQLLGYNLSVSPTNAAVNATNGIITWTPTLAQTATTNTFTTIVTDNGTPSLSATNSFSVVVISPVTLSGVVAMTNGYQFQWNAPTSMLFQVQWKSNLTPTLAWNSFTDILTSTTGTFTYLDDGSQSGGLGLMRFYRVLWVP